MSRRNVATGEQPTEGRSKQDVVLTTCSVTVSWGDAVLGVWHFDRPKPFRIGDDPASCDFVVPPEDLPEIPFALVDTDGSSIRVAEGCARDAARVTLVTGTVVRIPIGDLDFVVRLEPTDIGWKGERLRRATWPMGRYALFSAALTAVFVLACITSARNEEARGGFRQTTDRAVALMRTYLAASDERELREREPEIIGSLEEHERKQREHARIMKLPPRKRRQELMRACFQNYMDHMNEFGGWAREPHADSACREHAHEFAYPEDFYWTRDYRRGLRRPPLEAATIASGARLSNSVRAEIGGTVERAPPYRIEIGEVTSSGGGAAPDLRHVLDRDIRGSYMCAMWWRPQPARGDQTFGIVNVALELGPDGVVSSAVARGHTVENVDHAACLERYFREAVFPGAPPGVRVDVPVNLRSR